MLTKIGDLRLVSCRQRFGLLLVRCLAALQELVYTHVIIRRMNKQHLWNAYNMRIRNGQCDSEITAALAREIDRRIQLRGSAC